MAQGNSFMATSTLILYWQFVLQRRPATTIQQGGTDSRATSNSETFCNRSQNMLPSPAMQAVAADPSEVSVMRAASLGLWTQGMQEDAVMLCQ